MAVAKIAATAFGAALLAVSAASFLALARGPAEIGLDDPQAVQAMAVVTALSCQIAGASVVLGVEAWRGWLNPSTGRRVPPGGRFLRFAAWAALLALPPAVTFVRTTWRGRVIDMAAWSLSALAGPMAAFYYLNVLGPTVSLVGRGAVDDALAGVWDIALWAAGMSVAGGLAGAAWPAAARWGNDLLCLAPEARTEPRESD